ncbi:MAG: translation elongation factor Ts [Candidatus Omnitrophota bacterium]|nr:MAG: translation elongation factor Ts [Candidatus Omnitrophota bacterium]
MLDAIKKLREKTQAGIMDCKKALKEATGNVEKAIEILRKKGIKLASLKSSRAAKDGRVESYIHMNGKIGVLVEVNCETDFVARNEEFKRFAKDISMQIAATKPKYVKREDILENTLEKEKEILAATIKNKPKEALDKILAGKLEKFYEETCLLDQPFVKDPKIKVKELLQSLIAKIGENIVIRRFVRYQLGEDESKV